MKRLMILLISCFLIILVLSSCIRDNKTEIPQPIKLPTNTETKTPPVSSTPSRTQEVYFNAMTDTPTPSKTKTPLPATETTSPTFTDILDGKLVVLRDFSANYLEDILTGRGYNLLAESKGIDILRWAGNGCTLIAATRDEIVEMDLQGKILRTIFSFDKFPTITDGVILSPPSIGRRAINSLSPNEAWIAYKIGSGNFQQRPDDLEPIRYELENLEIMSVDGTQRPYRLSQNGGAWRAAWSPDSAQIAYSDYDDNRIHQLFIINRDGTNRRQVSSFTSPAIEILNILWSPDGDKIALLVGHDGNEPSVDTIVIDVNDYTSREHVNIMAKWWRDNESFIAVKIIEQEIRHEEYIAVDINTNHEYTVRPEACYRINPFGDPSMMGCMTVDNEKFIVYDTNTFNVIEYPNFKTIYDIQYWIAAPDSYPGGKGCGFTP